MSTHDQTDTRLSLVPLGAGDLIDRAVRFYRRNFLTFILMAAPPVVAGSLLSVGWTVLGRQIFVPGQYSSASDTTFYYMFVWLGSLLIWLVEAVGTLVVMGGAARNFVRHLLFGEAISLRETYSNVAKRFVGLVAASSVIGFSLGILAIIFFYITFIFSAILIALVVGVFASVPVVAVVLSIAIGLAAVYAGSWLYFLVASRFAYVPQIMLVEGQGMFSAVARSATLASGSVRRLMALFAFTTMATLSALALLYVPLTWYAWANGIEISGYNADLIPAWLEIGYSLIWQISFILLSPIWTIGLCLLYVDERVRSEGYDIELMAARRLGEIPDVPQTYINPLQPALGNVNSPPPVPQHVTTVRPQPSRSVLGLD